MTIHQRVYDRARANAGQPASLSRRAWLRLGAAASFALGTAALTLAPAHAARAEDLRVGLAADVTSMDPQWNNAGPNNAIALHVFESLVFMDKNARYIPGLALSWKPINPTTWEIKLRPNVKWHDGSPFTSADVKASLERPEKLVNSPGTFTSYTKPIKQIDTPDALTVRLTMSVQNYANLANDLNSVPIMPKAVAATLTQADFDSGKAMIGTGPFKFVRFARGQEIVMQRNPDYWGPKVDWDRVTFRILTDNGARTAALLSGDVDVIESVPAADVARLKKDAKYRIEQQVSWRTIFWQMDQSRDNPPFVTDKAGKPLGKNPFKDARVRAAISKAINRDAIVNRIMEGLAVPASSIVSPQIFGHPGTKPEAYDAEGAKKLLAAAGYPNGFGLTLHATNNRYLNDNAVAQATAAMLTRIGIQTKVETMPVAAYFTRARQGEFSFQMLGWGSAAADVALRSITGTPNPQTGFGTWNWGKYSNPQLDKLIETSLTTVSSDKAREENARAAARFALDDHAIIPSHSQLAMWAMRKGVRYEARTDEWSLAQFFHKE
ncbi:ABC transporter substrate-binding protein [Cupriavidus plantarum]|uniref:ABC transporter substrate-binding protein n=1 Tax=Cupriavidus plantarum TaxID=942865 RepID=UPI001B2806A4|nr:ABC transporter substrate-binding protein [Cupriavidus plantarum]CAG2143848.1 Glutathione-binding protein GsiB [Cupriavidus plantarum]SMR65787.1 peptide/nickel transport system substrate-binding protein [Cupriavidus plantarum]